MWMHWQFPATMSMLAAASHPRAAATLTTSPSGMEDTGRHWDRDSWEVIIMCLHWRPRVQTCMQEAISQRPVTARRTTSPGGMEAIGRQLDLGLGTAVILHVSTRLPYRALRSTPVATSTYWAERRRLT